MANKFNDLESNIVTALESDSYFSAAAGNVGKIEEKLRENPQSGYESEFPRVGVFVYGGDGDDIAPNAAFYRQRVNVLFEVTCTGGDAAAVDTQLKRVLAELRRFIRDQNQLDTKLSDSTVRSTRNLNWEIAGQPSTEDGQSMNIHLGYTRAEVEIYET